MIPYVFTLEKNQSNGTTKKPDFGLLFCILKISFKKHTQALIRDKLPEAEGNCKSVVAEFHNKNSFSLMEQKTWTM